MFMFMIEEPVHYAGLKRRIEAALIDSILIASAFFGAAMFVSQFDINPFIRIGVVLIFPIILEPVLISFTGATIGHRMRSIRVERDADGRNLSLIYSLVRFITKFFFGLLSMILILATERNQALHDILAGSVVVISDASKVSKNELFRERSICDPKVQHPSVRRRTLVTFMYLLGSYAVTGILWGIYVSKDCLLAENCTSLELEYSEFIAFVWLIVAAVLIIMGCRSSLWGCRLRRLD